MPNYKDFDLDIQNNTGLSKVKDPGHSHAIDEMSECRCHTEGRCETRVKSYCETSCGPGTNCY